MAPVGTDPAPFLDWGGESRLVTSLSSPGPGWPGIGGMTEDYTKIGTALARGELAREPVPISTEESTSGEKSKKKELKKQSTDQKGQENHKHAAFIKFIIF